MKQEFIDYELHLQMFIDAGADAHARHLYGEPIKPEGYDEYKTLQNADNQIVKNKNNEFSYVDFIKRLEIAEKEKEQNLEQGLLFDSEGIPQYLSADDHYNGIENPEWTKKHPKKVEKPSVLEEKTKKESKIKRNDWHEYDEDGIPQYLNYHDRYNGDVNPEWLKKHEPDLWLKLYGK
jgi:hypothetical protein